MNTSIEAPAWWSPLGEGMELASATPFIVTFKGGDVEALIMPVGDLYHLMWKSPTQRNPAHTTVPFSAKDLASAFGLSDETEHGTEQELRRYDATCMGSDRFVRAGKHLSIQPNRGNVHGDKTVSLYLHDNVVEAVRQLLAS